MTTRKATDPPDTDALAPVTSAEYAPMPDVDGIAPRDAAMLRGVSAVHVAGPMLASGHTDGAVRQALRKRFGFDIGEANRVIRVTRILWARGLRMDEEQLLAEWDAMWRDAYLGMRTNKKAMNVNIAHGLQKTVYVDEPDWGPVPKMLELRARVRRLLEYKPEDGGGMQVNVLQLIAQHLGETTVATTALPSKSAEPNVIDAPADGDNEGPSGEA